MGDRDPDLALDDLLGEDDEVGFFEALRALKLKRSQERTMKSTAIKEQKRHSFTKDEIVQKRAKRRIVVGSLKVSELVAVNLIPHARRNPYFYLAFEGERYQTNRKEAFCPVQDLNSLKAKLNMRNFPHSYAKELFYWPESFEFPVTDVAADLTISLYSSKVVGAVIASRTDLSIGKIVIPLSQILSESPVSLTAHNTVRKCEGWFELYPLPAGHLCFTPVVKGLPETGLPRPERMLGKVYLKLELTLFRPVLLSYMLTGPYRPLVQPIPDRADARYIKGGDNRIKRLFANPPYFVKLFRTIRRWEQPKLTFLAICVHTFLTYCVYWWQLPFFLSLILVLLGYSSRQTISNEKIEVFNDEIEKDPNHPDTIVKKLKVLFALLAKVQKALNKFASSMERLLNALSWTDERVSLLMSFGAIIAGAVLSVIAKVVETLIVAINMQNLVFVIGLLVFGTPISLPSRKSERDVAVHSSTLRKGILNLIDRIPDENEVIHRKIAKQQQIEFYVT